MSKKKIQMISFLIFLMIVGCGNKTNDSIEFSMQEKMETINETVENVEESVTVVSTEQADKEEFPISTEYSDSNVKEVIYEKFHCGFKYVHVKRTVEEQDSIIVTLEANESKEEIIPQYYLNIYRNNDCLSQAYREKLWNEDTNIYEINHYSKTIDSELVDVYEIRRSGAYRGTFVVCYSDVAYLIETDYVSVCDGILDCVDEDEYLVESRRALKVDGCAENGGTLYGQGILKDCEQIYQFGPNRSGMEYSVKIEFEKTENLYVNKTTVQRGDETIQEFNWESNGKYVPLFGDYNHDQYMDIALNCMAGVKNEDYCLYLWNENIKQYEKFQCDTNLPYFVAYEEGIKAWYNNTYASKTFVMYKWDGIRLVKIAEEEMVAEE